MKGIIDRIEDGKIAVITITNGGVMHLPVEQLKFKAHEGAHLSIEIIQDQESEEKLRKKIKDTQQKLLNKKNNNTG